MLLVVVHTVSHAGSGCCQRPPAPPPGPIPCCVTQCTAACNNNNNNNMVTPATVTQRTGPACTPPAQQSTMDGIEAGRYKIWKALPDAGKRRVGSRPLSRQEVSERQDHAVCGQRSVGIHFFKSNPRCLHAPGFGIELIWDVTSIHPRDSVRFVANWIQVRHRAADFGTESDGGTQRTTLNSWFSKVLTIVMHWGFFFFFFLVCK